MAKLKNKEPAKPVIKRVKKQDGTPSISMRYLTKDFSYRAERFEKQPVERLQMLDGLYQLMNQIGNMTWTAWIMRSRKQGGPEKISKEQIRSTIIPQYAEQQSFFLSVRFGNADKYRLLGFREDDVFYVIGFDLDFSAYEHGS